MSEMARPLLVPLGAALVAFLGVLSPARLLVSDAVAQTAPKPARVSFVAYPGGRIYVNDTLVGTDTTPTMTLRPDSYTVRIDNRFLGTQAIAVELTEGQIGVVLLEW